VDERRAAWSIERMAIQIEERFVVRAPVEPVWNYLVDPRRVVTCVPGGELQDVLDDRTFDGRVRVAAGPFTFAYGGRIRLDELDAAARHVKILGDARDATGGGDRARMTLESDLAALPDGATEVVAHARVDVEGRIVEMGRGVLEQLAHVVFQDFASRVRASIEAEHAAGAPCAAPAASAPVRAVPLVFRAIRAWMGGWFRPRAAGATPS
jgi:carbon monoxide dehydrogenase subunit G